MSEDEYCMPLTYKINQNPEHFDDVAATEKGDGEKWQREVYRYAAKVMKEHGFTHVADIGCGAAFKLMKYLGMYDTVGFETEPCYSYLKSKYPERKWVLSGEPEKNFIEYNENFDLIICADVIEHIIDPDLLIDFIKKLNFKYVIMSTPNQHFRSTPSGPPVNKAHVREWNHEQFTRYMEKHFTIIHKFHDPKETQIFLLERK